MNARFGRLHMDAAGQSALNHRRNLFDLVHHARKLVRIDGLGSVGESLLGLIVHFNHDAVSTHSNGGTGHGQHLVALAGAERIVFDADLAGMLNGVPSGSSTSARFGADFSSELTSR